MLRKLQNYIHGQWSDVSDVQTLDVMNPATVEVLARVPLSPTSEVDRVAQAAAAFPECAVGYGMDVVVERWPSDPSRKF